MTENVRKKPSREKFVEFCAKRLHVTREDITEAIWEKCESVKWLKKNADLYELYKKCAAHVEGVRFHWIKKRNSSIYQKWANEMTYTAYCAICGVYNIEKTPKIKP